MVLTCAPVIEGDRGGRPFAASAAEGYTSVSNGRFKGGWTTRHYGQPEAEGWHAIQMELAQSALIIAEEAAPWNYLH